MAKSSKAKVVTFEFPSLSPLYTLSAELERRTTAELKAMCREQKVPIAKYKDEMAGRLAERLLETHEVVCRLVLRKDARG